MTDGEIEPINRSLGQGEGEGVRRWCFGTDDARKDASQCVCGTLSFILAAVEGIREFKEGLADGIGERDGCRVDKGDVADTPSLNNEGNQS